MEKNPLMKEINPDESVIWSGRPDKKAFVLKSVFNILLPISALWLLFDIPLLFDSLTEQAELSFFLVPFFLFHLFPVWIYIGNIFFSFKRYSNTYYLLTDKSVYLSGGIFSCNVKSKPLNRFDEISVHRGITDKIFKVGSVCIGFDNNMQSSFSFLYQNSFCFVCLPDCDEICRRIRNQQAYIASWQGNNI